MWTKPNQTGKSFPKIAFIKYFDPIQGFIGTGEYLDNMEQDIQGEVLKQIGNIRYGDDGYIFVVGFRGVTLMNGVQTELIGRDMWEMTDPYGVKVIQEERRAVENPNGDFIHYHWRKPSTGEIAPKISFVKAYRPWEWIIGAGVYVDEVEKQTAELERKNRDDAFGKMVMMALILTSIFLFVLLISSFMSRRFSDEFGLLVDFFKRMEDEGRPINTDELSLKEMKKLGDSANSMLATREKAGEALRESERKWRNILIETPQIGVSLNSQAAVVFCNKRFLELTGWRNEEVLGRNWFDLFVPREVRAEVRGVFDSVMRSRDTLGLSNYENEILTKSGERLSIAWSNVLTKDSDGTVIDVTCLGIDLTERKRAEDALRESESKFKNFSEQSLVGIYLIQDGVFQYVNPRFAEIFGYSVEECRNMSFRQLVYPEDLDQVVEKVGKRIAGEIESMRYGFRGVKKSGEVIHVEIFGSSMEYRGRTAATGTMLDTTARMQAEAEREKLQAQLIQAQKMQSIGRLAGGVAHDFNNMLGVILGHTELAIEQVKPDEPLFSDLREIQSAAQRSADLTRKLLAFARKQTISPKVLDLNETVEGMLKMLRRLIGEDVELSWLPEGRLWTVNMDPSQVDQILANLCVNARDAVGKFGKITIGTANTRLDETNCADCPGLMPGEYVQLSISDNGCGMDRKALSQLFEPFFTTKKLGEGTGLGLATVYGIVRQNNGHIDVHSEPGEGTTFKIFLPRYVDQGEKMARKEESRSVRGGHETILIVEDEEAMLNMAKTMLERLGYRALAAGTPGEALKLANEHASEIDLVITDVVMPEMNGKELVERLSSLYPNMRSLFTSGYTADVIGHHGVLNEGVHFIQKPFSRKDLASKVREVLSANHPSPRRQEE